MDMAGLLKIHFGLSEHRLRGHFATNTTSRHPMHADRIAPTACCTPCQCAASKPRALLVGSEEPRTEASRKIDSHYDSLSNQFQSKHYAHSDQARSQAD